MKLMSTNCKRKELGAAVVLALASPLAFAATLPTATQVPGNGTVVLGSSTGTSFASASGNIWTLTAAATATNAPVVIEWGAGSGATLNTSSSVTAGFDIGSSATVNIVAGTDVPSAVLNIDTTANASYILGTLSAQGQSFPVFVANGNGIVVGTQANIVAPQGLGLINTDLTQISSSSTLITLLSSDKVLPLSFEGATGGVTISAGANLASVSGFLFVAGAGAVNIAGAPVNNNIAYGIPQIPTVIDAGVGGYVNVGGPTPIFTAQDQLATPSSAQSSGYAGLTSTNYSTSTALMYLDATSSNVTLNLGTSLAAFDASSLNVVAANNINLASTGNLADLNDSTFNWGGTLTNNGILNFGTQSGSNLLPTTTAGFFLPSGLYANTTTAVTGGFVNASGATINAGSLTFSGASFSNSGTIQLGQDASSTPFLSITASSGDIDLAASGALTLATAASSYTGPLYLGFADLVAGGNINVDSTLPNVGDSSAAVSPASVVFSAAGDLTVNSAVNVAQPEESTPAYAAFTGDIVTLNQAVNVVNGQVEAIASGASGTLLVNAPITASTSISLYASSDATISGPLSAGSSISVYADNNLTETGTVSAGSSSSFGASSNANLSMASLTVSNGGLTVLAGNNLNLSPTSLSVSGGDVSVGGVSVATLGGTWTITGGNLTASGGSLLDMGANVTINDSAVPGFASLSAMNVTVAGPLTMNNGRVAIGAQNVDVQKSITVTGGDFSYFPIGGATSVLMGTFSVASGATVSAQDLRMGTESIIVGSGPGTGAITLSNYVLNGDLVATGTAAANNGTAIFGYGRDEGSAWVSNIATYSVSGAGSIAAGTLDFAALKGSVNNVHTGQILANGFQLIAPSSAPMAISVNAIGAAAQGFNVQVQGSAVLDSGETLASHTLSGNSIFPSVQVPANANSNLVVQTTGNLTVNSGSAHYSLATGTQMPVFQWPGLVYLQANGGQLTANAAIDNGYSATQKGSGVFVIAANIIDTYPIYSSGPSGVVFAAPYNSSLGIYPYATTINGANPTLTSYAMPTVYFAQPFQSSLFGPTLTFSPASFFSNEYGLQQETQTFLTLP